VRTQPILSLALVAACAHHAAPPVAPDYRPVTTAPAPPQAALYADCLADAAANHRIARATDPDTTLLLFTCTGAPAKAFFDGLAAYSAKIGSEFTADGHTFRATQRVRHDLFGVDYCSAEQCVITLNTGPFAR
jgi:hypothetical protein